MHLLIDGDIVAYRAASSCELTIKKREEGATEVEPLHAALGRANQMFDNMMDACDATGFTMWLSGNDNFRKDIYPLYKAQRPSQKPTWLEEVREYLIRKYDAQVSQKVEADDMIIIEHDPAKTIICSNDKDFKANAWGAFFNFTLKKEHQAIEYLEEDQMYWNFAHQMLRGDKVDNIKAPLGHQAIKTADTILIQSDSGQWKHLDKIVRGLYKDTYADQWKLHYRLNYRLLRLLRNLDELDTIYKEKDAGLYPVCTTSGPFEEEVSEVQPDKEAPPIQ